MVRENEVRDADIWPCSAGDGDDVSAKRSRSLRMDEDWRRAELKSAFYCGTLSWLLGAKGARGTNHDGGLGRRALVNWLYCLRISRLTLGELASRRQNVSLSSGVMEAW